ncbi:MAG: alpha-L-fucosidase, partial [Trebonia sp.]
MSPFPQPISRRRLLVTTGVTGAAAAAGLLRPGSAGATVGPRSYSPAWASVDQHPPAPEWFQDAKFGVYYHWGVFSVPAFSNEWYPRNMYDTGSPENLHHIATYGDPSVWPYHYFMLGADDKSGNFTKFQPKFVSNGGNWDPDAWAELFVKAGARFAGPVAEHHDGYSMWDSQVNEWNSVNTGPHLDLLRIHSRAIRSKGLKFMCSLHHAYHFLGYYQYVPPQSTPTLQKLYAQQGTAAENLLWYNKLVEVIDGYQPDMIWQDFDLSGVEESYRLQFLADYYNAAVAWDKDVVATYKDGLDTLGEVFDFERGGAGNILTPYWLTDDAVSPSTWCYVTGITYYSTQAMLHSLIDHVSKGGNLLLNVSPMADGTIPSDQQEILLGMGDYLGRFGESIYDTRIWETYGEGPTAMGGGSFAGPKAGTPQDVRFTRTKDNRVLYVTALGWQGATMTVKSLNSNQFSIGNLRSAQLLDNTHEKYIHLPKPAQDTSGLHFTMPSATAPFSALAYVVKLTFSGQIPAWSPPTYVMLAAGCNNTGITNDSNTGAGNVDGNGYSFSAQALAAAGASPGAVIKAGGLSFTWPSAAAGSPDNVVADG